MTFEESFEEKVERELRDREAARSKLENSAAYIELCKKMERSTEELRAISARWDDVTVQSDLGADNGSLLPSRSPEMRKHYQGIARNGLRNVLGFLGLALAVAVGYFELSKRADSGAGSRMDFGTEYVWNWEEDSSSPPDSVSSPPARDIGRGVVADLQSIEVRGTESLMKEQPYEEQFAKYDDDGDRIIDDSLREFYFGSTAPVPIPDWERYLDMTAISRSKRSGYKWEEKWVCGLDEDGTKLYRAKWRQGCKIASTPEGWAWLSFTCTAWDIIPDAIKVYAPEKKSASGFALQGLPGYGGNCFLRMDAVSLEHVAAIYGRLFRSDFTSRHPNNFRSYYMGMNMLHEIFEGKQPNTNIEYAFLDLDRQFQQTGRWW